MDCIFCKIIKGEIPSYTIYENDIVKVFLDVAPEANGHCLIVPKKHTENLETIDNKTLLEINETARKMINLLKEKLNCSGVTLVQNNGEGQAVKHYHLHLIPRYENDNLTFNKNENSLLDVKEVFKNFN